VNLDILGLEPDKVINIEEISSFLVTLVLFLYLLFRKLKSSFDISADLGKVIELLV
jgi:hypothetical protein